MNDLIQRVNWGLSRIGNKVCSVCQQKEDDEVNIHLTIYYLDCQGIVRSSEWDIIVCQWCFSSKMNLQEKIEELYA